MTKAKPETRHYHPIRTHNHNALYYTKEEIDALPIIDDTAYNESTWDANTDGATKNVIRDQFEALASIYAGVGHNHDSAYAPLSHSTSDGTDHTYIDQDVRTSALPQFAGLSLGSSTNVNSDHKIQLWGTNGYTQWIDLLEDATYGMGLRYNADSNTLYFHAYQGSTTPVDIVKVLRDTGEVIITNESQDPSLELEKTGTDAGSASMIYNSSNKSIDFIFG